LEAVVLAGVAVLTAWSGYQAAKWEALSAASYVLATRTSVRAQEYLTLAGQDRLYDIVTFNGWLAARSANNMKLAELFERRFGPNMLLPSRSGKNLTHSIILQRLADQSSCPST
jgi:hypothetical protein